MRYVPDMFTMPRYAFAGRGGCNRSQEEVSTMTEKVPILVVLGIDVDGRPHASRFEERDTQFVARAAELMGLHVIRVPPDSVELHGIAEALPLGKIFATGRAFVPFVGRPAFDRLATMVEGGVITRAPRAIGANQAAKMLQAESDDDADALWAKVEVGTVVLAAQPDLYGPGWWEGVVVGVDGDDLTLRWMDDPELESFHLSRRDIALRHPGAD
jgi:hypothetical protein